MNKEIGKNKSIAIEITEILKKHNVTYKDAIEVLGMVSKIIDKTTINPDSLNIKTEYDMPNCESWVSEQKLIKN